MDYILDFFDNKIALISALSWFIAQFIKIILNLIVEKKIVWERLWGDGGMPSGHSATVTTLALLSGWCYGFDSIFFAICGVLAIIVMHDAMGVRLETGKQAQSIKEIATTLNELLKEKDVEIRTEKLKLLVGHTPLQVFFGFLLGIIVTVCYCWIALVEYKCLVPVF